uniref:Uncharacterized protein n=1 Tax=Ixodes ricinus TaxID=34613 RepID=A0A131XX63_IXORI
MAVLACQCLNWSVHCQESRVEACDPRHLDLSEEERTDRFFASAVARVKLGIGGISQKHPFLSTVRHVGQWSVHSCRGCRQDVYAEASGRMLLNAGLESGQEKMDTLRALERYSPCFKIVLPQPGDDDDGSRGVSGARLQVEDSKLDANLKVVQEIANRFVRQEMEAMEARIRHFQEQQSRTLEQLKARTAVDRDALCELLTQASRRELKNTLAEALDEEVTQRITTVRSNAVATTQNRGGLPKTTDNDRDAGITFQKGAARRQGVRRPARPGRQLLLSQSVDTGQIFHLDGFEDDDNSAPFPPASSEEELDTDDSSMADEYQPAGQTQCAYSLPVDMPTWRTPRDSQNDLDELVGAVDHEKIGEDIEALARSVCDGTEMFGDLPRPRLNAGDHRSRPL